MYLKGIKYGAKLSALAKNPDMSISGSEKAYYFN